MKLWRRMWTGKYTRARKRLRVRVRLQSIDQCCKRKIKQIAKAVCLVLICSIRDYTDWHVHLEIFCYGGGYNGCRFFLFTKTLFLAVATAVAAISVQLANVAQLLVHLASHAREAEHRAAQVTAEASLKEWNFQISCFCICSAVSIEKNHLLIVASLGKKSAVRFTNKTWIWTPNFNPKSMQKRIFHIRKYTFPFMEVVTFTANG